MADPSDLVSSRASFKLRKVRTQAEADDERLTVTLFKGSDGGACGWFIGPLSCEPGRFAMSYLPRSRETPASVAVVRAIRVAEETRVPLCLVDPDDLWDRVWRC